MVTPTGHQPLEPLELALFSLGGATARVASLVNMRIAAGALLPAQTGENPAPSCSPGSRGVRSNRSLEHPLLDVLALFFPTLRNSRCFRNDTLRRRAKVKLGHAGAVK